MRCARDVGKKERKGGGVYTLQNRASGPYARHEIQRYSQAGMVIVSKQEPIIN